MQWGTETPMGPTLPISEENHALKYRQPGESFREAMTRVADALKDNDNHFHDFRELLLTQAFLPAGRVQAAMGANRVVTPYNCFVSGIIPDSMDGIMDAAKEAAQTMRMGGGIGYDFSTLRPKGDLITKLDSYSSGPVSFMDIFDSVCGTIAAAGHRRGAQMGVLRVDHPDIEEFIHSKTRLDKLTNFNISVGITDNFMEAVEADEPFDLVWGGKVYKTIRAKALWNSIMRNTWDWAEPGCLFLDRINRDNNLWYCEDITATNPCAEQPLPPFGACLLGSINLVKYVREEDLGGRWFDLTKLYADIPIIIRAMDNVVDRAIYPLPEQEKEAKMKRRMGIGVTGAANAIEALGHRYGDEGFLRCLSAILETITVESYAASTELAAEKGAFPLFSDEHYWNSTMFKKLPQRVQDLINKHGLRNSHLTSIAPTGTISLTADNVSSGIEPVFSHEYYRTVNHPTGPKTELIDDYGLRVFGVKGKTADECSVDDHLNVLLVSQKWSDSAVSKTCNIGDHVTFDDFSNVYMKAWKGGAKGCTTFRAAGKRRGILNAKPMSEEEQGAACYIDAETGKKTCE